MLAILVPLAAAAPDFAKEQRWREQVVGDLFDGEPVTLNDGDHEFLGLYTQADEPKPDAVVVMHGVGVHPDWPEVVNPLRVALAERGWTTLSIQMPVLANDADPGAYDTIIADAGPRIDAATRYLKDNGAEDVFLVAHSMGSRMTADFLAGAGRRVKGFVGIGMNAGTVGYLDKILVPLLDLYGGADLEGVLASAADRARASAHNAAYTQTAIDGADHFFKGMEQQLIETVSAWLTENE